MNGPAPIKETAAEVASIVTESTDKANAFKKEEEPPFGRRPRATCDNRQPSERKARAARHRVRAAKRVQRRNRR